jgi:hypothetical protein
MLVVLVVSPLYPLQQRGPAGQVVEGPGQRGRGGLVARQQQRDQVVAQFLVGLPRVGDQLNTSVAGGAVAR